MRVVISERRLAYVSWNSDGKVDRIVHEDIHDDSAENALERIARRLGRPHSLTEWDVNWCERDQDYYVHETGGWTGRLYLNRMIEGCQEKFWAADGIEFCLDTGGYDEITPEQVASLGYVRVLLPELPEDLTKTCEEQSCQWCESCDDMIPDNGLCSHMYWCGLCGVVITEDEECHHDIGERE